MGLVVDEEAATTTVLADDQDQHQHRTNTTPAVPNNSSISKDQNTIQGRRQGDDITKDVKVDKIPSEPKQYTKTAATATTAEPTAAGVVGPFQVSKLYDRETEIRQLQDCCYRILGLKRNKNMSADSQDVNDDTDFTSSDESELVLVTGPSGSGKTVVIQTALQDMVEHELDGYFIRGKFDQFEKPESYSSFAQALNEYVVKLQQQQQKQGKGGDQKQEQVIESLGNELLKEVGSEGIMSLAMIMPQLVDVFGWKNSFGDMSSTLSASSSSSTAAAAAVSRVRLGSDPKRTFCHVICRFISLIASKEHPIVLFLDDLQWADQDSLDLLSLLLTDSTVTGLIVVGACRGNEVSYEDNLAFMLRSLEDSQQLQIAEIRVGNLSTEALHDLAVDVYANSYNARLLEEDIQAIIPFVSSMTQGNAFHSLLVLRSLMEEGVLYGSDSASQHIVSLPLPQQIRSSSAGSKSTASTKTATTATTTNTMIAESDNGIPEHDVDNDRHEKEKKVEINSLAMPSPLTLDKTKFSELLLHNQVDMVDLLCQGLSKLDNKTQKVLQVAACLGAEFELRLLIVNETETSVGTPLECAIDLGLIREKANVSGSDADAALRVIQGGGGVYMFTHDKIQQACYALIPVHERPQFHLDIGRTIFEAYATRGQWVQHAMVIANQLQLGLDLIVEEQDRLSAAYIFEVAARNAYAKSSFTTSGSYLKAARSLLPRRYWRDCYDRALAILTLEVDVLCATGQYDEIDSVVDEIVENARSMKDKTSAYTTQIYSLGCRSRLSDALDLGFVVLKELGEPFPKSVGIPRVLFSLLSTTRLMKGFSDEQILTVKVMEDPMKLAAMRILNILTAYAFQARPSHGPLIVTRIVQLTLKYGQSAMSAPGFAFYGFIISSALQDLNVAVRSGNLALAFQNRYQSQEWIPRVYACVYGLIKTLVEPLRNCVVPLTYAFRTGLDSGDVEWACVAMYLVTTAPIWICQNLDDVDKTIRASYYTFQERSQQMVIDLHLPYLQGFVNLRETVDITKDPLILTGTYMSEETALKTDNNTVVFTSYLMKLYLACIFNEYEKAEEYAIISRPYESGASLFGVQQRLFLEALALLVLCRPRPRRHEKTSAKTSSLKQSRRKRLRLAKGYLKTLKKHASYSEPSNLAHRIAALEAGFAMVRGDVELGISKYKEAVGIAFKEKIWGEESLISEVASMALRDFGWTKDGQAYLKNAKKVYEEWGAHRKVIQMEQQQRSV